MRHIAFIGVTALLAACGGSNSSNNNGGSGSLKTFNYGSPQAPSATQQNTATKAQTQMNAAVSASVNGQVASAASLPTLTDSLAASLPAAVVSMPEDAALAADQHQQLLASRHSSALVSEGCTSISNTTITYNNCTYSGSGISETFNGTETVSGSTITWNLTATWNYSSSGFSENGTYNWTGQLTITASGIKGDGRSTASGHYSGSGTTYDFQYTTGFDVDLSYGTNPFCITSGTLEVRRTLNSSSNAGVTPVHDAGAKYTWTGCGVVMVATST
jgi:hypothetical protein